MKGAEQSRLGLQRVGHYTALVRAAGRISVIGHKRRRQVLFALVLLSAACATAADTISGQVHNLTQSQVVVGDQVLLLRPEHAMKEEVRTETDAQGRFTLPVQHSDKSFLLRIIHRSVNYDELVASGAAVSVNVFDTSPRVEGITGTIEVIRAGTLDRRLHVSDMMELQNLSSPPRTQFGRRTFNVYLPRGARMDSVLAAAAGNLMTVISAHPVPGEPGHYSVSFPLRPGSTKFAFNYDLPYQGRAVFPTKHEYPLQQLIVMAPPSMEITSRATPFRILPAGNKNYQARAIANLQAGPGPDFEISGGGALPPLGSAGQAQPRPPGPPPGLQAMQPRTAAAAVAVTQPPQLTLTSKQPDVPPPAPHARYFSLRTAAISSLLFFAAVTFLLWRALPALRYRGKRDATAGRASAPPATASYTSQLESLKEELFQLETARTRGQISGEEYASTRSALEQTIARAVRHAN